MIGACDPIAIRCRDRFRCAHFRPGGYSHNKCGNAKLVELAKAGAWKRGVREEIDVAEWPFKPDLFKEAYVLQASLQTVQTVLYFGSY